MNFEFKVELIKYERVLDLDYFSAYEFVEMA